MYALGSSAEYRSIANLFGVGRTTVGEIVLEFCTEVWRVMRGQYWNFYSSLEQAKLEACVRGYEKLGFPQCCGAIDGCHIEMSPPKEEAYDYYNFKGWHSVVLLAAVDYRYCFNYINVGLPGRVRDSYIFETSRLHDIHNLNPIFKSNSKNFGSCSLPVHLIGDSGFALSSVLMKPYPESGEMLEKQRTFNYKLSSARRVVENAFGHLKARFRKIGKGLGVDISNVNIIIKACCVVHNFLNVHNDQINKRWLEELRRFEESRGRQQPVRRCENATPEGVLIREAIAEKLFQERQLPALDVGSDDDADSPDAATTEENEDSSVADIGVDDLISAD